MGKELDGKKVLVTGASSGIGKAIAILFAETGADIGLVARSSEALAEVAAVCQGFGVATLELATDITVEDQVKAMASKIEDSFSKIDVLVNNAGYGKYAPFADTPITEWDRMWAVNVRGTILVTQAVLPSMIDNQMGHIVNISSIHGIHTAANATAYCATKHALNGFSEALAKELWQDGIKVSTINPGGVLTPFLGIPPEKKNQEFLEPEDVAGVVLDVVCASHKTLVMHTVVAPRTRPFVVQEIS
jgi:uncharacterized protein